MTIADHRDVDLVSNLFTQFRQSTETQEAAATLALAAVLNELCRAFDAVTKDTRINVNVHEPY